MRIKKIKFQSLIDIIVCLLIFNVHIISTIPVLDTITDTLKIVIFLIISVKCISKRIRMTREEIALLLIFGITLLCTIFNGGDFSYVIIRFLPIIMIVLYLDINAHRIEELFGNIYISSSALIMINAISMVLYPEGIYTESYGHVKYWIIGQKQDFVTVFIIFLFLALWYSRKKKKRIVTVFTVIAMGISFVIDTSFGLFLVSTSMIIMYLINKRLNVTGKMYLLVYLILEITVVSISTSFQIGGILSSLLEVITFNGSGVTKLYTMIQRFDFWNLALKNIASSPIFGIGFESSSVVSSYHNMLLDITVCGGVVCLIAYLIILFYAYKRLDKFKTSESMLLRITIFSVSILSLTETVYFPFVFVLFFLPSKMKNVYLVNEQSNVKNRGVLR